MAAVAAAGTAAQQLLDFIDASPSPWHAVDSAVQCLLAAGFIELDEADAWSVAAGGRYFVRRGGSSLIALVRGTAPLAQAGLRLIGAHTDSPGLRLKPRAAYCGEGMLRLGVEVYGGPLLATFADRDLGLAGRVMTRSARGIEARLVRTEALVRLPNLAIHMNREVNEHGLKFNKQTELPLFYALAGEGATAASFTADLAARLDVAAADILSWELGVFDTQAGAFWGPQQEFIASRQIDNLASCHAGLDALLGTAPGDATCICALFDHEEVGSGSATGADGSFIADLVERLAPQAEERQRMLARSFFISADMAHAWNPNFPAAYEPAHRVLVNGGPVIKCNANQRYSTSAASAAHFMALCEAAGVPCQQYAHRTDLGCGSTIGPIVAARLGIASVDVGAPMWAMHSARESAGALDHTYMTTVLRQFFAAPL